MLGELRFYDIIIILLFIIYYLRKKVEKMTDQLTITTTDQNNIKELGDLCQDLTPEFMVDKTLNYNIKIQGDLSVVVNTENLKAREIVFLSSKRGLKRGGKKLYTLNDIQVYDASSNAGAINELNSYENGKEMYSITGLKSGYFNGLVFKPINGSQIDMRYSLLIRNGVLYQYNWSPISISGWKP